MLQYGATFYERLTYVRLVALSTPWLVRDEHLITRNYAATRSNITHSKFVIDTRRGVRDCNSTNKICNNALSTILTIFN